VADLNAALGLSLRENSRNFSEKARIDELFSIMAVYNSILPCAIQLISA
jgi:hypothetical protein